MEYNASKYDIAIEQLDKITNQLGMGLINKKDFDGQRLIILIELSIASVKEFVTEVTEGE